MEVYISIGDGVLNGVTFTGGVSGDLGGGTYAILLAPGSFASGIWVGMEGLKVLEVNSTGSVLASGSLVSVNSEYGYIIVDYVPTAASAL